MAAIKLRSQRAWFIGQVKSRVFVGSCVATLMASCSLRNLDELDKGWGEGGSNAGGSSSKGGGFTGATAGTGNITTPTSGAGSGGISTASGGATTTEPGTTTVPAGGVSSGGQAATTAAGGVTPVPASCPVASTLSGTKIYSYGFESGLGGWERVAGRSGTVLTDVSMCEGNSYFTLPGATRTGAWDGPAFNFYAIATLGNSYFFSAAVRFHPPQDSVAKFLQATVATYCDGSSEAALFSPLTSLTTAGNDWARLETLGVPFVYRVPPSGCSKVTKLTVYFESEDAASSIDVDDAHIWEVAASTGGAGGGGGVAGAAGSAGVAANAGAGGSG